MQNNKSVVVNEVHQCMRLLSVVREHVIQICQQLLLENSSFYFCLFSVRKHVSNVKVIYLVIYQYCFVINF